MIQSSTAAMGLIIALSAQVMIIINIPVEIVPYMQASKPATLMVSMALGPIDS